MDVHTVYWVMIVLAIIPLPLLLLVWPAWVLSPASLRRVRTLLLIVATSSYIWLLLAMKFPAFLGGSYRTGRLAIIDVNFVVMLVCSIASFRGQERRRIVLGLSCISTALMWGILGAINSVA
jgi:hypothetical protein